MDEESGMAVCSQLSFVFEVGVLDVVHEPEINDIIIYKKINMQPMNW